MTPEQRKRQMQAIHIQFKRHQADGVLAFDTCHLWASQVIGRLISTLDACSDFELNYLRDALNGKAPKIVEKIHEMARQAGIGDLHYWMAKLAESKSFAWLRGPAQRPDGSLWRAARVHELPVSKQYRLLKLLERRRRR